MRLLPHLAGVLMTRPFALRRIEYLHTASGVNFAGIKFDYGPHERGGTFARRGPALHTNRPDESKSKLSKELAKIGEANLALVLMVMIKMKLGDPEWLAAGF